MRYAGWICAVVLLVSLAFVFEVLNHLHGPDWAIGAASVCLILTWFWLAWFMAGWTDRQIAEHRRREDATREKP